MVSLSVGLLYKGILLLTCFYKLSLLSFSLDSSVDVSGAALISSTTSAYLKQGKSGRISTSRYKSQASQYQQMQTKTKSQSRFERFTLPLRSIFGLSPSNSASEVSYTNDAKKSGSNGNYDSEADSDSESDLHNIDNLDAGLTTSISESEETHNIHKLNLNGTAELGSGYHSDSDTDNFAVSQYQYGSDQKWFTDHHRWHDVSDSDHYGNSANINFINAWNKQFRYANLNQDLGQSKYNANLNYYFQNVTEPPINDNLKCHKSNHVPSGSCPSTCPFFAEDPILPCNFICVKGEECGGELQKGLATITDIPDQDTKVCRRCKIRGCKKCEGHHLERCEQCQDLFFRTGDTCTSTYSFVFYGGIIIGLILFLIALCWLIGLMNRKVINQDIAEKASNHWPKLLCTDEDGKNYTFSSDLHNDETIGGAGFCLHMDFLWECLVWAILVLLGWYIFASLYPDAWTIGTLSNDSTLENCQAVHTGKLKRDQLMDAKTWFVGILYVFTTLFVLSRSLAHRQKIRRLDAQNNTMMDYTLTLSGFPIEKGKASLEKEYKDYINQDVIKSNTLGQGNSIDNNANDSESEYNINNSDNSQIKLIGISIVFDVLDPKTKNLDEQIDKLISKEESNYPLAPNLQCDYDPPTGVVSTKPVQPFRMLEDLIFGEEDIQGSSDSDSESQSQTSEELSANENLLTNNNKSNSKDPNRILTSIPTSGKAFAVFQTKTQRDRAMNIINDKNVQFRDKYTIVAQPVSEEPEAMFWENISNATPSKTKCILYCGFCISIAVLLWAACFYLPYAYFTYLNFGSGIEPDFYADLAFSMLVVGGNAIMYILCDYLADTCYPLSQPSRESIYVILYSIATIMNLVLDLGVVTFTTFQTMIAQGIRTDDGVLLGKLTTVEAIVESYPLQKFLAENMWGYNLSCFVIPFMFEPFVITAPTFLGKYAVRSKAMKFRKAVDVIKPQDQDLGRYADHILNLNLTGMVFFLASGWIAYSLAALVFGNLFIYIYDRWRAVSFIREFKYSSSTVDDVTQRLLALPCATLAAAFVFLLRQKRAFGFGQGYTLLIVGSAAATHFILHQIIYSIIKAITSGEVSEEKEENYEDIERHFPRDFFNMNKIHCLRCKYIHNEGLDTAPRFYAEGEIISKKKQ